MKRANPLGGVDHDGGYNPWDMTPDQRKLADECEASGGFVFRTGVHNIRSGMRYGDGLQFVRMTRKPDAR